MLTKDKRTMAKYATVETKQLSIKKKLRNKKHDISIKGQIKKKTKKQKI